MKVLIAGMIALATLIIYARHKVDADTFALDPSIGWSKEVWKGQRYTAFEMTDIEAVVADLQQSPPKAEGGCQPTVVLWLGNSQLHYINQYTQGDHVSPYWLRRALPCPDTTVPLGLSLPNANLQEHYVLAGYTAERIPLRGILLELVFDDLREDGVRAEFSTLLHPSDREALKKSPTGAQIIERADTEWASGSRTNQNAGLEGFVQKHLEDRLDAFLAGHWSLWASRSNLRGQLLIDLYYLRNAVLGIKPTTKRRLIKPRYERNMQAFRQLLTDTQTRSIPLIAYIAPIRQDTEIPYDRNEYEAWKLEVTRLAEEHGAVLINLEAAVPAALWGSYHRDDIDFMHFKGKGHEIVAEKLLPYVQKALRSSP